MSTIKQKQAAAVQYPYAYDENNDLVFIEDVDKTTRKEHQYHCACGEKLIPRIGITNAKHFAHDHHKCGLESYIHKFAKSILARRFNDGGLPLTIKLSNENCRNAETCKDYDTYLCRAHSKEHFAYKEYCLSDHYTMAIMEEQTEIDEKGDYYRADVVLKSGDPKWKDILLEINYKHKSSTKKIESGLPIIEFDVNDIAHLKRLETIQLITDRDNDVHLYGFKKITGLEPSVLIERIKQVYADEPEFKLSDTSLPMCGRSATYFRNEQTLRRLTLFKSGKTFEMGIYETEINKHHPSAVMDITYDSSKVPQSFDPYILFAKMDGRYRACGCCHHCVVSGTTESTYCDLGKNGTSWKGTFDDRKGTYCSFFQWRRSHPEYDQVEEIEPVEGVDYTIWINSANK